MATQVQFRRGTTADISTFIGADGEVVVDTTKKVCVIHDGVQVAGYPLLREDGSNSALSVGSLSNCALKFVNDPNTGIISPGADQVALVTGGSSRLSIDSAGSVTIPGNLLVSGSITGSITFDNGSAGVPAVRFTNDPDTGIYLAGTNQLAISTNGTKRIEIQADGDIDIDNGGVFYDATNNRLAIGTTSPGQSLSIVAPSTAQAVGIWNRASDNTYGGIYFKTSDGVTDQSSILNERAGTNGASLLLYTKADGGSATERARIDSSGRLLVGTSSARSVAGNFGGITNQILFETVDVASFSAVSNKNDSSGPIIALGKSRSGSIGGVTAVQAEDILGAIKFAGANGTDLSNIGAEISAVVDGAPFSSGDTTDLPGRLVFSTTADGASSPTERMRITSNAYVRLASGTGGIQFNGDTAAANALNDYEEGTWTPTYAPSSGSFGSATYSSIRYGKYTKIGNLVACTFVIAMDALTYGTGTGNIKIAGLPFLAHASSASQAGNTIIGNSNSFYNCPTVGTVIPSSTEVLLLYRLTSAADPTNLNVIDMASSPMIEGNYISGCVVYTVS